MDDIVKRGLKDLPTEEVEMVFGAWVTGMGVVLTLIGLNVWLKATVGEHCCKHHRKED